MGQRYPSFLNVLKEQATFEEQSPGAGYSLKQQGSGLNKKLFENGDKKMKIAPPGLSNFIIFVVTCLIPA